MRKTALDQTMQAKQVFEAELAKYNVKVKSYRTDNRRFTDLGFHEEVEKCNQEITFCGIEVHHQNNHIEKYINKITTRGRIMLLYAKRY